MTFHVSCAHSHLYDFETASLIEGLKNLGIIVYANSPINGAIERDLEESEADFYIEFANRGVKTDLIRSFSEKNKKHLVYVNGEDLQDDNPYNIHWDCFRYSKDYGIYFRREFYTGLVGENEFPLQFSAMDEYFQYECTDKDDSIVFPSSGEYDNRRIILEYIGNNNLPVRCGRIGIFRHSVKPEGRSAYYRRLNSALAVISAFGWGEDTARFWEAAAAGACVITQRFNIEMPYPYTHMDNVIFFDHPSELVDIVEGIKSGNIDAYGIGKACKKHTSRYHSSIARAKYFLKVICDNEDEMLKREGFGSIKERIECENISLAL